MDGIFPTVVPGMSLHHASLTDLGCRREKNEDAVGFQALGQAADAFLFVVADGVGGSSAGEVASQLAVDEIKDFCLTQSVSQLSESTLRDSIVEANRKIFEAAENDPRLAGMATTCTAALIQGRTLHIGHVGDSRAYLMQEGRLYQLTEDHSVASDYERQGVPIPPEKANLANVLTRWLGTEIDVQVDLSEPVELDKGDTLVLCSDGLTKVLSADEILHAVSMFLPKGACAKLIEMALERGGPDNITVQIAKMNAE